MRMTCISQCTLHINQEMLHKCKKAKRINLMERMGTSILYVHIHHQYTDVKAIRYAICVDCAKRSLLNSMILMHLFYYPLEQQQQYIRKDYIWRTHSHMAYIYIYCIYAAILYFMIVFHNNKTPRRCCVFVRTYPSRVYSHESSSAALVLWIYHQNTRTYQTP